MNFLFHPIVYVIESPDGYTDKPIAYFSDEIKARKYLTQRNDPYLSLSSKILNAIQINDKIFLLGEEIDLDQNNKKRQENLINSAQGKLTKEEWDALVNRLK